MIKVKEHKRKKKRGGKSSVREHKRELRKARRQEFAKKMKQVAKSPEARGLIRLGLTKAGLGFITPYIKGYGHK